MNAIHGMMRSCNLRPCVSRVGDCLETTIEKVAVAAYRVMLGIGDAIVAVASLASRAINWVISKSLGCFCSSDASYQGVVLNHGAFALAPDPMDLAAMGRLGQEVDVADLLTEYRRIYEPGADNNLIDRDYRRFFYRGLEIDHIGTLVRLAQTDLRFVTRPYDQLYYATMKTTLQCIILELRNPNIPDEKKRRALRALVDGAGGCNPRKLEECQRQLRFLKSTAPEMNTLLLGYIQDLKEEIFLQAFQDSQFHVLNNIRSRVGTLYGLNTNEVNLQDPYIHMGAPTFDVEIQYVFHTQYTTQRVVQGVLTRIHLEENNSVWNEYIRTKLRAEAVARGENPNDPAVAGRMVDEATSFFDERLINERGVIFLLKNAGIVVPA